MAFIAEVAREVAGPPEAAFDRLADHSSWPRWMPPRFFPVGPSLGPLVVGKRPRVRIAHLPMPNTLTVAVAERGRELTWTAGSALLHARHRFLFEALEGNRTRIRSVEAWDGLLAPLLKPLVLRLAEQIGREQLEALAGALTR